MNKAGKWTEAELAQLGTMPDVELAIKLDRTYDGVRIKRQRAGIANPETTGIFAPAGLSDVELAAEVLGTPQPLPKAQEQESAIEDDFARAASAHWQTRHKQLKAKYEKLIHERTVIDTLVSDIRSLAPLSYSPAPPVPPQRKASGTSQSAVLLFSDTHVGQTICPDQTLGFGEYNFSVFLSRLKYLEQSVISIRRNHTTTPIDELVVAMLGDMLHGALNHGGEADQQVALFDQYYAAGHAVAQFFRNLAPHFPKLRIKTCVGNHTRWMNQHKMPTGNRYSNLDMFMYALAQALTVDLKNVEWDLNRQPFALFEVQNHVFRASHGDHLKGGDKALGIPNHAIAREISTTTQLFAKYGRQAPHYYLCGHLHRGIQLPHALGEVIINGGFPGLDNYALAGNFNPVDPMQRLLFVHPKYGRTAEYPLSLKFAEAWTVPPYTIPGNFPIDGPTDKYLINPLANPPGCS